MSDTTTERDEWFARLLELEGDERYTTMAVFADWLQERGEADLGYTMQWASERQRFPTVGDTRVRTGYRTRFVEDVWIWRRQQEHWKGVEGWWIPASVFDRIDMEPYEGRVAHETLHGAFDLLAGGLAKCLRDCGLPSRLAREYPHLLHKPGKGRKP